MHSTPRFVVAVLGMVLAAALAIGCGSDVVLESIAVTPSSHTGSTADQPFVFTATGTYSDNTTSTTIAGLTWTSGDTNVITIDNTGAATCVSDTGAPITITATAPGSGGNVAGTATMTCTPPV